MLAVSSWRRPRSGSWWAGCAGHRHEHAASRARRGAVRETRAGRGQRGSCGVGATCASEDWAVESRSSVSQKIRLTTALRSSLPAPLVTVVVDGHHPRS